ncbi:gp53-like domain-containing protein, partial [Escherichia coli]
AAKRDVGNGANQIPDMSSFLASLSTNGYQRFPGGLIIQWGNGAPDSSGLVTINYPVAHTQKPFYIGFGYRQSSTPTAMQSIVLNDTIVNNIGFQAKCFQNDGSGMIPGQSAFFWFSVGK